ncbi:MAG: asparagine synthase [Thaumarchaeota archaeon]|nr:asparagine synthase [Nitrososphaerota archaeon]
MEEYNQIDSLKSILTLRYDHTIPPSLRKLSWSDFVEKNSVNETDAIENYLIDNIRNELSQTKKISIALSGGIDSSLMLALIRKTIPDIHITAISIIFAESFDESKEAGKLTEQFDAEHKIIYVENFFRELPKSIYIIKRPFWDLHWYTISKEASKLSDSLVSGDGGDELFGGYAFRYQKFLSLINPDSSPLEKIKAYLQCHERDWVPDQDKIFGKKIPFDWNEIYSLFYPYFDNSLPPLAQVFLADYNGKLLYNFSPINTAFHKFFKIKSVTPIINENLISYSSHLKYDLKYDIKDNLGKPLLRKILSKNLPNFPISDVKRGFSVDTVNLWKSYGYKLCNYYLSTSRIVDDGLVSKEWIDTHLKKELDVRYVNKFYGLLATEIWFRLFITKEMKENETLD